MSAALDPHCWKATSLADPEYVMDFRSPRAFCALAITVFASCAMAFPHRYARQIPTTTSFFTTVTPPFQQIAVSGVNTMTRQGIISNDAALGRGSGDWPF